MTDTLYPFSQDKFSMQSLLYWKSKKTSSRSVEYPFPLLECRLSIIFSLSCPSGPIMFISYHQANIRCFRKTSDIVWNRILKGYREWKYLKMINTTICSYKNILWVTKPAFCLILVEWYIATKSLWCSIRYFFKLLTSRNPGYCSSRKVIWHQQKMCTLNCKNLKVQFSKSE